MNIKELLNRKTLLSFELFPPNTDLGMENLCKEGGTLDQLYQVNPDYISCTYRVGGSNASRNLEVLSRIQTDGRTIPVTHFTCIGNTPDTVCSKLQSYLDCGIDHVLALRGDIPLGYVAGDNDLRYATELVELIRREFGERFTIAVAGNPEGHIQCRSIQSDIEYLKQKQDLGADYIITQLCWDMDQFKWWYDAIRAAGITLPVDVGVMPVLDSAATINMALSHNACVMPRALCEIISRNWIFPNVFTPGESEEEIRRKKESFMEEGIQYTIAQVNEYLSLGVDGIHLFALNKAEAVSRIIKESNLSALL